MDDGADGAAVPAPGLLDGLAARILAASPHRFTRATGPGDRSAAYRIPAD